MEKEFLNIVKVNLEQHGTFVEVSAIWKAGRKGKPIPHKTPSLSDLGRDRLRLLQEIETLSSAAKGKARTKRITKRSCEKTSTHIDGSESEDDFGEALQEMMKEVGNNWRERRGPIPDVGRNGLRETLLIKMDENEDKEETLSSGAKGKANGEITKRSCEKTSTHNDGSEGEDDFGEALQEMMKEVGKSWRERREPIPDVGRNGLRETLLIKMEENEDEAVETLSSAAKGKANGGITKRSCVKISTHSDDSKNEDDFGEALQEMMKEVGNNCREIRGPIPGKPLSSQNNVLKIMGGELSVLGMGGIGETTVHNNGTTINYTIGTLQMTNHHHYYKQERDEDD